MSRFRRYKLPPPENAEHIVGELFEFLPEHDQIKHSPADFVELIPAGPEAEIWEIRPEHDLLNRPSIPTVELGKSKPADACDHETNPSGRLNEPSITRRALFLLNVTAAMSQLSAQQFAVFELVVMDGKTMTEVAAELNIPRTTAIDFYRAVLASVRRTIMNDPGTRILLDAMSDLYGQTSKKTT
jgi:hypothetical protein